MRTHHRLVALALLSLSTSPLVAQGGTPPPCSAPEYRQFDFWAGEWDVANALGTAPPPQGHSRITLVHGGCAVHEEYETVGGYEGSSLSYFDAGDGQWHQTWIDNQGSPVLLAGGMEGEAMMLYARQDGVVRSRLSWTPLPEGRVRQLWERTDDGGTSWTPIFDGTYTQRTPPTD